MMCLIYIYIAATCFLRGDCTMVKPHQTLRQVLSPIESMDDALYLLSTLRMSLNREVPILWSKAFGDPSTVVFLSLNV